MQKGLFDGMLRVFLLKPIRCRKCRQRFYRLRIGWPKYAISFVMIVLLAVTAVAISRSRSGQAGAARTNPPATVQGDADRQR